MQIENTTHTGISKVKEVTIRYTVTEKDGSPREVIATISKDTKIIGSANANVNGTFGVSFNAENGISHKDRRSIVDTILQDVADALTDE